MIEKRKQLNIDNFPPALKERIKIHCVKQKVSIKDFAVEIFTKALNVKKSK